ncbi:AAA family ATPase [Spongiactinospora sp. TRM90649]|uniref:MinD/ParA family ATP-binding protein n=1 Tax=Spongiactinospora sp. TRM90649 TaxID=3031114 RepID=UPI0023F97EFC|nr:AAA family ATPase [Spongiactinospora sp. TRM90649]MDF5752080.1 AAA family ATPase [Spongiactinospora sp. TRM90649]
MAVSSPHGGTGKTSLVVNLASVSLARGRRVAVVDTAMQSPGLSAALGLTVPRSLADYLCGTCDIAEAVRHHRGAGGAEGAMFVVAACRDREDAAAALVGGYDPGLLVEGCHRLVDLLDLDLLLLDTPPGLNTEALVSTGIADTIVHVDRVRGLRSALGAPTATTSSFRLVVNMVPATVPEPDVREDVRAVYGGVPPLTILPYVPELAASAGVFVETHPGHDVSARIRALARTVPGAHGMRTV